LIRRRGIWLLASGVEERNVWGKKRGIIKEGLENRGKYIFKLGEGKKATSLTFRKCVHTLYSWG
jgi:hypothetical protein